jgi:hypothetical protein
VPFGSLHVGSTRRREERGRTVDGRQASPASAIEASSATSAPRRGGSKSPRAEKRGAPLLDQSYGAIARCTSASTHDGAGSRPAIVEGFSIKIAEAFCCAVPDVLTVADDRLGRMFLDMAARYGIPVHARKVKTSSLSFIMPNDGKRAIVRCRDDDYLHPFPNLHLSGYRARPFTASRKSHGSATERSGNVTEYTNERGSYDDFSAISFQGARIRSPREAEQVSPGLK